MTQDTNLAIGKRRPEDYFGAVEARNPGALASQWIPADPELWRIDRYPDFLAARRELLAEAANTLLDQLRWGGAPGDGRPLERLTMVEEAEDSDSRVAQVTALIAEACWPEGLQPGQGNPVILELDPAEADLPRLEEIRGRRRPRPRRHPRAGRPDQARLAVGLLASALARWSGADSVTFLRATLFYV